LTGIFSLIARIRCCVVVLQISSSPCSMASSADVLSRKSLTSNVRSYGFPAAGSVVRKAPQGSDLNALANGIGRQRAACPNRGNGDAGRGRSQRHAKPSPGDAAGRHIEFSWCANERRLPFGKIHAPTLSMHIAKAPSRRWQYRPCRWRGRCGMRRPIPSHLVRRIREMRENDP